MQGRLQSKEKAATDLEAKNKTLKTDITAKNKQIKELEKEVRKKTIYLYGDTDNFMLYTNSCFFLLQLKELGFPLCNMYIL